MREQVMRSCPSYIGCAAPICPLETVYPSDLRIKLENEVDCVASKPTRLKLGHLLKYKGLTKREHSGWLAGQLIKSEFSSPEES